jgi:hypothetical protein
LTSYFPYLRNRLEEARQKKGHERTHCKNTSPGDHHPELTRFPLQEQVYFDYISLILSVNLLRRTVGVVVEGVRIHSGLDAVKSDPLMNLS